MLSLAGFIIIVIVLVALLSGRVSPIVPLVIVPIAGALAAGFSPAQVAGYTNEGLHAVMSVATMFIFAVLFFSLMNDAGLFDPLVKKLVGITKGNVVWVCVATVLLGAVGHLDGVGATTFLILIPPLLPVYKRLRMDPYLLLLLGSTAAAVMNMVPWGGPVGRAAVVLTKDPTALWRPLIPLQLIGLALLCVMAVILGMRERRRIARRQAAEASGPDEAVGMPPSAGASQTAAPDHALPLPAQSATQPAAAGHGSTAPTQSEAEQNLRPRLLRLNALIAAATIGILVWGLVPPEFVFMVAACVALQVNYPGAKAQLARIKAHANSALLMGVIILAAGSFLGIMSGTGMMKAMATDGVALLPGPVTRYLHIIIGVLGIPLELVLNTDAFFFALMPVSLEMVQAFGVDRLSAAYPMMIGKITGTFVCPLAPAVWLALGLANLEMGKHLRYSFFWVWGFSLVLLVIAWLFGIYTI
ncbi:MAG TPA: SLC13 family permease [Vicinamibacterales bacterium]|nr:SLC13 family permease [Vicinamibacterales bacterium]HPK70834.1 SLC13 family permease [Vicinamibacterales bacterium]